jgi:hypothetical protein
MLLQSFRPKTSQDFFLRHMDNQVDRNIKEGRRENFLKLA